MNHFTKKHPLSLTRLLRMVEKLNYKTTMMTDEHANIMSRLMAPRLSKQDKVIAPEVLSRLWQSIVSCTSHGIQFVSYLENSHLCMRWHANTLCTVTILIVYEFPVWQTVKWTKHSKIPYTEITCQIALKWSKWPILDSSECNLTQRALPKCGK